MDLEDFLIIDSNRTSYERYESLRDAITNDDGMRLIKNLITCNRDILSSERNALYVFVERELKSQIENYNDQRMDTYEKDDNDD